MAHGTQGGGLKAMTLIAAVGVLAYLLGMSVRPDVVDASESREAAGPGYSEPLPATGPADAPVLLIEVFDYKCRFCRLRNGLIKRLEAEHRDDVRFVFKHFPFVSPTGSERGAIAAMAANRQGAFRAYSDRLLLDQRATWSDEKLVEYAAALGLDKTRFEEDLKDPALEEYVRKDKQAAETLRIRATPTLLLNGLQVPNNASADTVRMMVREAVAEVKQIIDRGEARSMAEARAIAAARNHPLGEQFARIYMLNDVSEF